MLPSGRSRLPCRLWASRTRRPVPAPGPVRRRRPVRPAEPVRPAGPDPRADDGGGHPVHRVAGRVAVLLDLADGGQGQGPALPAADHGPLRGGGTRPRAPHRPQPRGPAGHGGDLGPRPGRAVPVHGPGHPLAAAVPRGLPHAGAVQGLPGHQGGAGPRDGGSRDWPTPAPSRALRPPRPRPEEPTAERPRSRPRRTGRRPRSTWTTR